MWKPRPWPARPKSVGPIERTGLSVSRWLAVPVVLDRSPLSIKEIGQALLNVIKNDYEAIGKDGEVRASRGVLLVTGSA